MTEKYAELVLQKTSIACYFIKVQFIKARGGGGGGGKRNFFSFYILCDRAAEDEQVEKNRIKIRPCIPEILHAKV